MHSSTHSMGPSRDFSLWLVAVLCLVWAAGCEEVVGEGGVPWKEGRATYFDAPDYWKAEFQVGQFGDLHGNSCGYVNRQHGLEPSIDHLPFPIDGVTAVSDSMEYYKGGCGRCFEVRCKSGPIKLDYEHLMPRLGSLYLPDVAPSLLDPEGRPWPGVPEAEDQTIFWTACRNESKSIVVTTIDSCPCKYIGGRNQSVCCGPIDHLDLSYWAFNKLAHPLYGKMMLEYRPVDCSSHKPLDSTAPPISDTIYDDRPGRGWSWRTFYEKNSTLIAEGEGLGGSAATCVVLTPNGGLAFYCRECHSPGYQPFNKDIVKFWIRSDAKHNFTFTPAGELPNLELFLSQKHELKYTDTGTTTEPERFCNRKPKLGDYRPFRREGQWYEMRIPIKDFGCINRMSPAEANRIVFVNPDNLKKRDAHFCLDEVELF